MKMAKARKELNWSEQIKLAIDPIKAQRYRSEKNKADDEACSMCGDYCAMKIIKENIDLAR